jgi:hypothetical protein
VPQYERQCMAVVCGNVWQRVAVHVAVLAVRVFVCSCARVLVLSSVRQSVVQQCAVIRQCQCGSASGSLCQC